MHHNFRVDLRERTRHDHSDMDELFSLFDVAERTDLLSFMRIHLACFGALAVVSAAGTVANQLLSDIIAGLRTDLETLQNDKPKIFLNPIAKLDPLAVDYVLGGSRMGTKLLRVRWSQSSDPRVKEANAYFNLSSYPQFWQTTCQELAKIQMNSDRAEKIVADTTEIFNLFKSTYHQEMLKPAKAC